MTTKTKPNTTVKKQRNNLMSKLEELKDIYDAAYIANVAYEAYIAARDAYQVKLKKQEENN